MRKDTAIAVYIDDDEYCAIEIHWLHRSWLYSGSNERSDILMFHNPAVDMSKVPSGEGIIHIPLKPTDDPVWHDYPRVNSTYFLTTKEAEITHNYDYTFRTDIDTFLTKNFVTFKPRLATFGHNAYASVDPEVARKISQICQKWGIRQYHMNTDCHVMAYSKGITEYAKMQYSMARRLKTEEFKDGHGEWPGWYEYIINMYSAGIAANAFFGMGYSIGGLGCMSMSPDPIGSTDYHIHAFHTYQNFSKIKWREGYYDCLDLDSLDDHTVINYCIKMAGKRFI